MEAVGESGRLNLDQTRTLETVSQGYTYFRENDVIVAKITPCFENGKGALCKGLIGGIGFGTTELHVMRPGREVFAPFLFYLTKSHPFRNLGIASMQGAAGQQRVTGAFIKDFRVGLPPLPEQCAIANCLDQETAKIDALVAKKEQLIELLQEKRAALITRAVTKGLDPNVPMKDSGVEWLGEIPAHWEVRPLHHVLTRITYGFTNPMPVNDEGPFLLTANDIGDGEILYSAARRTTMDAYSKELTDKCRPKRGDILVTKDGTLGRIAVADGTPVCINQSVALLRADDFLVVIDFLQNVLRADSYQNRMIFEAGGTTIKHIYISRLAKMPVAFPPRAEQEAIAKFVNERRDRLNALIAKIREGIEKLKEYRTALISAAVTGKIDVRGKTRSEFEPPE
jgi:type I restriction enzyme S subunit